MIVVPSDAYAETAARTILDIAGAALATRGGFHIALSGGSTPRAIHRCLGAADQDFTRWHVYFGDERFVPADHPDSNYRMARETLLDHVPIPAAQIHPVATDVESPAVAGESYESTLRGALPADSGKQRFDAILLGLGSDGHTASLFPGTAALAEGERWVVANWVEKLDCHRITVTYPLIAAARRVVFLVAGANKRDILARVRGALGTDMFPAARINAERVDWIVDRAAAGP